MCTGTSPGTWPWLGTAHPDDADLMWGSTESFGIPIPVWTDESMELWSERVPEFIASLADDS